MSPKFIRVEGARAHNLKNITVEIPRDKFVVITGLSGSGKSSLAFDTIFAEGQRRYVESLSAYARQFLGQMEKPDVDTIEGLSPAVSIDQKGASHNPRSTVGTVTEIYDYLRLLFARAGIPHCPECGRVVVQQSAQEIVEAIETYPEAMVADHRYGYIKSILRQGVISHVFDKDRIYASDRIDRVLTHRVVGPIIMLGVLLGLYKVTFSWSEIPVAWMESFFTILTEQLGRLLSDGHLKYLMISGIASSSVRTD